MKKFIAVLAMIALAAGAVFAQVSVGGNIQFSTYLLSGDNEDGSFVRAGKFQMPNVHTNINFGDAEAGGMMRLWSELNDWTPKYFAFAWWRPSRYFRLQMGMNADGDWGHAQIAGWGFNGEAQQKIALDGDNGLDNFAAREARKGGSSLGGPGAWAPGVSGLAMNMSFYPMNDLTINVSIPYSDDVFKNAPDIYLRTYLNVVYNLEDTGTIRVSTQLGPGYNEGDAEKWFGASGTGGSPTDYTKIWAAFYLSAIDDMGVELGLGYQLPADNDKLKQTFPLNVGVGFNYTAIPDLGIKARLGASLAGKTEDAKDSTVIALNILPSYNLGFMRAYLNAGFGIALPDEGDTHVDWFFNPYIRKDVGSVRLYAGFQLKSNGEDNNDGKTSIEWGVPLGLQCYF